MKMRYEKCMKSRIYTDPLRNINDQYLKLDIIIKNMTNSVLTKLQKSKTEAATNITKLDTLSPLKTLSRGYSIIQKDDKVIKSSKDLKQDDIISIRLQDGAKDAKII